jgi:hypothetical protein
MTDNGARALAERLDEVFTAWAGEENAETAAELLEDGAAFLPDAAELTRLRRIEAAARLFMGRLDRGDVRVDEQAAALRAALQSEGSAGT